MMPVDSHEGISINGYDEKGKNLQDSFTNVQYIKTKSERSTSSWGTGIDTHIDMLHNYISVFSRNKRSLQVYVHLFKH